MNLSLTKKILLSVLGLGIVGSLVGMGTFASFNATVTNSSNSFATGTLLIGQDTNNDGTYECNSAVDGSGNNTDSCGALFSLTNLKPGSNGTKTFKVKNAGTLPGTYTLATSALGGTTNGTLPDKLMISIQDTTKPTCVFGVDANADGTCDHDVTAAATVNSSYKVGLLASTTKNLLGTGGAQWATTEEHTFVVKYALAADEGNLLQGKDLSFGLTWNAVQ